MIEAVSIKVALEAIASLYSGRVLESLELVLALGELLPTQLLLQRLIQHLELQTLPAHLALRALTLVEQLLHLHLAVAFPRVELLVYPVLEVPHLLRVATVQLHHQLYLLLLPLLF